jgi:hypothetical protein
MNLKEIGTVRVEWLKIGIIDGFCEHGNEPSDSISISDFLY